MDIIAAGVHSIDSRGIVRSMGSNPNARERERGISCYQLSLFLPFSLPIAAFFVGQTGARVNLEEKRNTNDAIRRHRHVIESLIRFDKKRAYACRTPRITRSSSVPTLPSRLSLEHVVDDVFSAGHGHGSDAPHAHARRRRRRAQPAQSERQVSKFVSQDVHFAEPAQHE